MIDAAVLAKVYAHARAAFPAECCGYIRDGGEVVACTNTQEAGENPFAPERGADSGFAISGAELLAFARSFDSPRPARVVYHSHPNGRAYFSEIDRAAAATDAGPVYPVQHLVVGVTAAGVTEAVLFAWSERQFLDVADWGLGALEAMLGTPHYDAQQWQEAYEAAIARARIHADACGMIDDASLAALAERLDREAAAVSAEDLEAHEAWARPRKWTANRVERGRPSLPILARNWLSHDAQDLRYRAARASSSAACDCQILIALGITERSPSSDRLRTLAGDGMYWEDYVCERCGARWTKHMDCDDVGVHSSWQPTR